MNWDEFKAFLIFWLIIILGVTLILSILMLALLLMGKDWVPLSCVVLCGAVEMPIVLACIPYQEEVRYVRLDV